MLLTAFYKMNIITCSLLGYFFMYMDDIEKKKEEVLG